MKCRFCRQPLQREFIDLVNAPLSNAYLTEAQLGMPETFYPLKLFVCDGCFLVQTDEYKNCDEIFNADYAYFSSFSTTWLRHARTYVEMIVARLGLRPDAHVLEIASNDGYLLQYFVQLGIPCLGIEPTHGTAVAARAKGVPTLERFFGVALARELEDKADLIIGNNVLAHVPDINDFVAGLALALAAAGTVTMEFPHLMRLVQFNQFDTIYHEHFSYLSLGTVRQIFAAHGLTVFDGEELPTHGGSLRIYAGHTDRCPAVSAAVGLVLAEEEGRGMTTPGFYASFAEKVDRVRNDFLTFLLRCRREGKQVAGYGAAAKGNTLLNYCGVKNDFIRYVVDRSPHKQGKFLPGSHIPIMAEDRIRATRPDYVLILPWNIGEEIMDQLDYIRQWGGRFVVAVPTLRVLNAETTDG